MQMFNSPSNSRCSSGSSARLFGMGMRFLGLSRQTDAEQWARTMFTMCLRFVWDGGSVLCDDDASQSDMDCMAHCNPRQVQPCQYACVHAEVHLGTVGCIHMMLRRNTPGSQAKFTLAPSLQMLSMNPRNGHVGTVGCLHGMML